jgi:hypothetical protein
MKRDRKRNKVGDISRNGKKKEGWMRKRENKWQIVSSEYKAN